MMVSPAVASDLGKASQNKDALVADEHESSEIDPAMHPLAAEEWLASYILAALGDRPQAVCHLSVINKNFYTASKSDLVWRNFLPPPTHLELLGEECDDLILQNSASLSLRDLYFHLCKSISLGAGLKKFWLDRRTGGECYILSARALEIAGGSQPEHWEWRPRSGAWFPDVAHLYNIALFEISGRFQQLLKPGSYMVSFRMQLLRSTQTWIECPIELSLRNVTYAQRPVKTCVTFRNWFPVSKAPISPSSSTIDSKHYRKADDGHVWVDCDVGEFTVEKHEGKPIEVEFSMRDVTMLDYWKTDFLLDGAIIRPSYLVNGQRGSVMCGYEEDEDDEPPFFCPW